MQFRRSLAGRGSTDFYFTEEDAGGMTGEQQVYLADLIMSYRSKYPALLVNAVWDFGMEEGDPVQGDKYGVFAECRDYAVYNAQMLTISFNHVRLRNMPCRTPKDEILKALEYRAKYSDLPGTAQRLQASCLADGVPWPRVEERIREELGIKALAENGLSVTDPCFADVQAVRMLENTKSIERITIHEIGHMISEESGAVCNKKIKKLFGSCRDGFEDLYEFCAECFMAAELSQRDRHFDSLSGRIGLAEEFAKILSETVKQT